MNLNVDFCFPNIDKIIKNYMLLVEPWTGFELTFASFQQ